MSKNIYAAINTACKQHGVIFMLTEHGWFWSIRQIEQPQGPHHSLKLAYRNWERSAPKLVAASEVKGDFV